MTIKPEELQEWLLHPVTKALRERYREDRERLKDAWANGAYQGDRELDAKVRGQCEILAQFLDLDIEDIAKES